MESRAEYEPATILFKIAQLSSWRHEVVRVRHLIFAADNNEAPKHVMRIRNLGSISIDNIHGCIPKDYQTKKDGNPPAGWGGWMKDKIPSESPVRQDKTIDYYRLISVVFANQDKPAMCRQVIDHFCNSYITDKNEYATLYPAEQTAHQISNSSNLTGFMKAVTRFATS